MRTASGARDVLLLGSAVLGVAALSGAWEIIAGQAPGSPLYIGMLPAPIEHLREDALTYGVLLCLAALCLGAGRLPRALFAVLVAGVLLLLLSGLYAAVNGMPGVQLVDLRPDVTWVFIGKQLGHTLLCAGLAGCAWRALRSPKIAPERSA